MIDSIKLYKIDAIEVWEKKKKKTTSSFKKDMFILVCLDIYTYRNCSVIVLMSYT